MTPAERLQLELAETFGPLPSDGAVRDAEAAVARVVHTGFLGELADWACAARHEDLKDAWVVLNREMERRLALGEVPRDE